MRRFLLNVVGTVVFAVVWVVVEMSILWRIDQDRWPWEPLPEYPVVAMDALDEAIARAGRGLVVIGDDGSLAVYPEGWR